jgi:hypothetical protein
MGKRRCNRINRQIVNRAMASIDADDNPPMEPPMHNPAVDPKEHLTSVIAASLFSARCRRIIEDTRT